MSEKSCRESTFSSIFHVAFQLTFLLPKEVMPSFLLQSTLFYSTNTKYAVLEAFFFLSASNKDDKETQPESLSPLFSYVTWSNKTLNLGVTCTYKHCFPASFNHYNGNTIIP